MSTTTRYKDVTTYLGLTTINSRMYGWHIVSRGTDKAAVLREAVAQIEAEDGPLVLPGGRINIHTDAELKNLAVVSRAIAHRRFGIDSWDEEFFPERLAIMAAPTR